jgi:hypothetical protein
MALAPKDEPNIALQGTVRFIRISARLQCIATIVSIEARCPHVLGCPGLHVRVYVTRQDRTKETVITEITHVLYRPEVEIFSI